jgi:hypothetical protein
VIEKFSAIQMIHVHVPTTLLAQCSIVRRIAMAGNGRDAALSKLPFRSTNMASGFGRRVQAIIDWIRRKKRSPHPADQYGLSPREARKFVTPSGDLERLFYEHKGRIAHKWHHYLEIYDHHFARFREPRAYPVRILELGVSRGGSLQIWRKYFGSEAKIVGVDIDPACLDRVDPDTPAVIGDQSDPAVLASALAQLGDGVDIVIDDGSHLGRHQIASFEFLYPRLSVDGLYACEDLQCCYSSEFEGGYRKEGTFIEYAKSLIDRLHAWYFEGNLKDSSMEFAQTTFGIFTYVGLIVIEKRKITQPFHVQIRK